MSRKLTVVLLAMLILVGAMSLKTVVTAHDNGAVIMATSHYGKGWVFAVGDPWLYNEYTDGRKLPAEYQNFMAAKDLSRWLLEHAAKK